MPVRLVSRHKLSWVLDTLARDLLLQIFESPSGGEYVAGWDPHWRSRYPSWWVIPAGPNECRNRALPLPSSA